MTLSYALTGLILTPIVKLLLCNTGMAYWLASIITMAIMVPLNFIMNKFGRSGRKRINKSW